MLRPLRDRLIIKPIINNKFHMNEKTYTGTVEASGPGRILKDGTQMQPMLKKGDKVMYDKKAGNTVTIDGIEYLNMVEADILAVLGE